MTIPTEEAAQVQQGHTRQLGHEDVDHTQPDQGGALQGLPHFPYLTHHYLLPENDLLHDVHKAVNYHHLYHYNHLHNYHYLHHNYLHHHHHLHHYNLHHHHLYHHHYLLLLQAARDQCYKTFLRI